MCQPTYVWFILVLRRSENLTIELKIKKKIDKVIGPAQLLILPGSLFTSKNKKLKIFSPRQLRRISLN